MDAIAAPPLSSGPPSAPRSLAERRVVPGGGCAAFALKAGDEIRITDPEGLQAADLFAFDATGADAAPALGLDAAPRGAPLAARLAGEGGAEVARLLAQRGIDTAAPARILLGESDAPGAEARLTALTDLLVVIAAGGPLMAPDEQSPPT
ncbi:MAG: DUF1989 domain-containing protein, partial [Pseudomonadota bacterium]